MTILHLRESWIWQGSPAHFIASEHCRFHLATVVGPWIVSTVGDYYPPLSDRIEPTAIGYGRTFETMVFPAEACRDPDCGCGESVAATGSCEDDGYAPANSRAEARANHERMCELFSRRAAE